MAISRLAVSNPAANTDILLYTADRAILTSVIATNKSVSSAGVRVWVVPSGQDGTPANWAYIAYDADITANNTLETFRFPVVAGDKVYVRATTADVSFQIMGIYDALGDTFIYAQDSAPVNHNVGDLWVDTDSTIEVLDTTSLFYKQATVSSGESSSINISTKPWNMPWGRVAGSSRVTSQSISTTLTETMSTTFSAVSNRVYKITYYEPEISNSATGYGIQQIRLGSTSGTLIARNSFYVGSGIYASPTIFGSMSVSDGSVTVVSCYSVNTGTSTVTRSSANGQVALLFVEDIGPA